MAKDPKNFTGEDVPALLAAAKEHDRVKGEWSLLGHFGLVLAIGIVILIALANLVGSWFR